MEHDEIIVNKLERPALKSKAKIHGTENFHICTGELQYLTKTEKQLLRERLTGSEIDVDDLQSDFLDNYQILLCLFILFSIAIAIACFATYLNHMKEGNANVLSTLIAWVFMEMIIALPFAIYLKWRGNYKKAVKRGDLNVYRFFVERKVVHEYYDDFHTMDYYIVVGGAYVEIGKNLYDRLHTRDSVRTAILNDKRDNYFALINDGY